MSWNPKASNPWDDWQNNYPCDQAQEKWQSFPGRYGCLWEADKWKKYQQYLLPPRCLQPETTACRHLLPRLPSPGPYAGCSDSSQRTPPHLTSVSLYAHLFFIPSLPQPGFLDQSCIGHGAIYTFIFHVGACTNVCTCMPVSSLMTLIY